MRRTDFIFIDGILFDQLPINESVLNLVFFIMSGGEIPPIKVQKVKNGWKLKDGRHRVAALKLLGKKVVFAKFYQ